VYGLVGKLTANGSKLASAQYRADTKRRIETNYATLNARNGDATDLLLQQARAVYDLARDRFKTLDGKAGTLIGIVTTGFGALAILGDPTKVPSHGVWIGIAMSALGTGFICALSSLAPRGSQNPDLSPYLWRDTLQNNANVPRIRFDLAAAWVRDAASVEEATIVKGRRLFAGAIALFIAIIALVINYAIATPADKPTPTIRVILQSPAPIEGVR
jgi:hypothetical protein